MQNDLYLDYLYRLVPLAVGNYTSFVMPQTLETIHANTHLYYNSFLPSVIREWNELPDAIRNLPCIPSFKRQVNANILNPPKYSRLSLSRSRRDSFKYFEISVPRHQFCRIQDKPNLTTTFHKMSIQFDA